MENTNDLSNKKKWLPIALAGVAIIIVVVIVVIASNKDSKKPVVNKEPVNQGQGQGDRPLELDENGNPLPPREPGSRPDGEDMMEGDWLEETNPVLIDAKAEVKGANLISKENKVITDTGEEIKTDVNSMSAVAPRQTLPTEKDSLPDSVIKIEGNATGFVPAEFKVKKGEPVTLALTSNGQSHNIKFDDPILSAVAVGPSKGETRAISFNAPTEAGEYTFYCGVPGHANRGERGKMIVE